MSEKKKNDHKCECDKKRWHEHKHGAWGGLYFVALVGAAVYYIQQADAFWVGVLGILKAIIWPAMLIH